MKIVIIKKSDFEALHQQNTVLEEKSRAQEELINVQRRRIEKLEAALKDATRVQDDKYTALLERYIALMERTVGPDEQREAE